MRPFHAIAALVLYAGLAGVASHAAEVELYPTGPAEDAAFLRFVDGGGAGLRVTASGSGATLGLDAGTRSTPYMTVAGGSGIEGEVALGGQSRKVAVQAMPGEFVTVLGLEVEGGLRVETVHDQADDFTAVRASVAFYNLNASCQDAAVQVAGRQAFLFEHAVAGVWARRQINPVPLSVQLLCGGQPAGQALDLGTLEAGGRYSLFLVPGDPEKGFFHVKDSVAR